MSEDQDFNLCHRASDGELLHVEVVTGQPASWLDGAYNVMLPKMDIRDGDTITLTPKPKRPALLVPLQPQPEFDEVEVKPEAQRREPIVGRIEDVEEVSAQPIPVRPTINDDDQPF